MWKLTKTVGKIRCINLITLFEQNFHFLESAVGWASSPNMKNSGVTEMLERWPAEKCGMNSKSFSLNRCQCTQIGISNPQFARLVSGALAQECLTISIPPAARTSPLAAATLRFQRKIGCCFGYQSHIENICAWRATTGCPGTAITKLPARRRLR